MADSTIVHSPDSKKYIRDGLPPINLDAGTTTRNDGTAVVQLRVEPAFSDFAQTFSLTLLELREIMKHILVELQLNNILAAETGENTYIDNDLNSLRNDLWTRL